MQRDQRCPSHHSPLTTARPFLTFPSSRSVDRHVYDHRACGGMGILVKEKFDPERPAQTHASFSLRNPDEVQTFLARLVSWANEAAAKTAAAAAAATS